MMDACEVMGKRSLWLQTIAAVRASPHARTHAPRAHTRGPAARGVIV